MATSFMLVSCLTDRLYYELCESTGCPSDVLGQQKQGIMTHHNVLLPMGQNVLGITSTIIAPQQHINQKGVGSLAR